MLALERSEAASRSPGRAVRGHRASFSGGHSDRATPVPIPNTEVKPVSADGTWGDSPWESRTPPDFLEEAPALCGGFFAFWAQLYDRFVAYDLMLADRVRVILAGVPEVSERRMFGGVAFMVSNNMAVGILGDELMVRVGAEAWAEAVRAPGVHEMDFTGRSMKGFVVVGAELLEDAERLEAWVDRGLCFAESLPPKQSKAG